MSDATSTGITLDGINLKLELRLQPSERDKLTAEQQARGDALHEAFEGACDDWQEEVRTLDDHVRAKLPDWEAQANEWLAETA